MGTHAASPHSSSSCGTGKILFYAVILSQTFASVQSFPNLRGSAAREFFSWQPDFYRRESDGARSGDGRRSNPAGLKLKGRSEAERIVTNVHNSFS
jgi:hypothetical protein